LPIRAWAKRAPLTRCVACLPHLRYVTDPRGIEIFNSVKGPGAPPTKVAPFGVHKDKTPYLDVSKTLLAIQKLIQAHPASFSTGPEVCICARLRALVRA
jgi:hypothetical protein